MQQFYKGWELLDTMPEGWGIDKTAGSPLNGYEFITNGRSVIAGQQRALLKIQKNCDNQKKDNIKFVTLPNKIEEKPKQIIDENYCRTVNDLARKKIEERLLQDIRVDLMICEIEGWSKKEYIEELKKLINNIGDKKARQEVEPKSDCFA